MPHDDDSTVYLVAITRTIENSLRAAQTCGQCWATPPSTTCTVAVMKLDSSEQRNAAA